MKEKPILFSTPMVQAILEGRKSQTRRVVKNQPTEMDRCYYKAFRKDYGGRVPPYQVGDRLWVRETWGLFEDGEPAYRTNYGTTEDDSFPPSMFKWKPSIFMPKKYARIWLEVTGVRVERLQDITEEDAKAEGVTRPPNYSLTPHYSRWFEYLWDSINGKKYPWGSNPWVWVYEFRREG